MASRFCIGIDLGTTNSALAYLDTADGTGTSHVLPLRQAESENVERELETLPSFLYLPPEKAAPIAGVFARAQSALTPGRVIASAKSWLCQSEADPTDRFLPWGSSEVTPAEKRSPVEVSAEYLARLKALWESAFPDDEARFDRQDITITVPASFDEAAQYATLEAARRAGYPERLRLLEEPQAAFYAYLEKRSVKDLTARLPALAEGREQIVLVCDIGGGTTDLSLFRIHPPEARQRVPRIERIAVSDHLLLGGDNLDLALAHALEKKSGRKLAPRQWHALVALARGLKEKVLAEEGGAPSDVFHVSVPGAGASLLQSTLTLSLTRGEIAAHIQEGFFPLVGAEERPARAAEGLREWGLPFATDSAITRHLAQFLAGREVDAVLFNGGTLKPRFLRERLLEQLARWQAGRIPVELSYEDLDLAVARGAAAYGAVLRRQTGRIRGGYPHAVYLELSRENRFEPASLVCLVPRGFEPGDRLKIDSLRFELLLDQPVRFQLFYSNTRDDQAGELTRLAEGFHPLPPLQTKLALPEGMPKPANGALDIRLEVTLSETGLLQVFCVHPGSPREKWQLDFNLRKAESAAEAGTLEAGDTGVAPERLQKALDRISLFYGKKKIADVGESPKVLKHELDKILGQPRDEWNLALLRALWEALSPGVTRRVRSEAHEVTWLYFAGLCLRPGYGSDLDPFRIAEVWKIFPGGPNHPKSAAVMNQWWILWRRIAGGLDATQQATIYTRLAGTFRAKPEPNPEMVLLAGSLERLAPASKADLGGLLLRRLADRKTAAIDQYLWALGRVANRVPLYAGAPVTVDPRTVGDWLERVLALDLPARNRANTALFFSQVATLTGDRHRDVDPALRERVLERMRELGASDEQLARLTAIVAEDRSAQAKLFGEALPSGLRLVG